MNHDETYEDTYDRNEVIGVRIQERAFHVWHRYSLERAWIAKQVTALIEKLIVITFFLIEIWK